MSEETPQPRSYAPQGTATGTAPSAAGARPVDGSAPATAAPPTAAPPTTTPRPRTATEGVTTAFRSALNAVAAGAPRRGEDQDLPSTGLSGGSSAGGPRRVRLAVSRIDPWSVMKLGFLLSIAIGIMTVVSTAVLWFVLDGMHVFSSINKTVTEVVGTESFINILKYVEFGRVISLAVLIAVINVVLLTALATIGAFLYNIVAALVGGIHLTLTDE
jgi:Transmembrane domain of unknown function (DUF3566)